ncbi:MAG: hypothetical protein ACD_82C00171G0001 [uncultured bacterium]|nr:MAG: hypothetical protein ACD_82C00171G0001 [uncultured bacterium]
MPKYRIELFIVNMLVSIDKIMRNTKDLDINQIVSNEKTFALTLR